MTEKDNKFRLFRKKEEEDKKETEAKTGEMADKRRAAARAQTDADIRARHEAQMEAAKAKVTKHVVASGESLSVIAKKYYDDAGKYLKIYEANKDIIGDDPSLIQPGMELVIPDL